jgi:hypothetical protein
MIAMVPGNALVVVHAAPVQPAIGVPAQAPPVATQTSPEVHEIAPADRTVSGKLSVASSQEA